MTLSTVALLSMEKKIIIANFLTDRPILAKIYDENANLSNTIETQRATHFTKLSPNNRVSLELSSLRQGHHSFYYASAIQKTITLELENNQNIISVVNDNNTIVIKDNNRQILATL